MRSLRIFGIVFWVILVCVSLLPMNTNAQVRSTPVTIVNTPLPVTASEPTRDSFELRFLGYGTIAQATVALQKPGVIETIWAYCYGGNNNIDYILSITTHLPTAARSAQVDWGEVEINLGQQHYEFYVPDQRSVLIKPDVPTAMHFAVMVRQASSSDIACSVTFVVRYNP
jgi:hypothetical protein